ncbi:MAG: GldG family protein [Lachnospiraceae bacterium]|nr:GldG family protein [Lachnospiraceae bacterium]
MKINRKEMSGKLKKKFSKEHMKGLFTEEENKKHLKQGSYSSILTVIVIAVVIAVNLVVGQIPSSATQIDLSSEKLYTLSDDGKKAVKSLDKDVTLYLIAASGSEDDNIQKLLNNFKEASSHIKVETMDPDLHPAFTKDYTSDDVEANSVIVVCGDKSKVVAYSSIYESTTDYSTMSTQTTGFDGEGQLVSAISYVTNDNMPILYTLSGHNETALGSNITDAIQKANIETKDLSLLTSDSVPEDADGLIICAPQTDLSSEEASRVISYLEGGGKLLMFSNFNKDEMPNFDSILTNYGLQRDTGLVLEGNSQHYFPQMPDYLIPNISSSASVTSELSGSSYVLIPDAQAIRKLDSYRDTLNITSLLTTTDSAYVKEVSGDTKITAEKADTDETGAFDVGVSVTETVDTDKETQLVYFSSAGIVNDTMDEQVSGGNTNIVIAAINSMCSVDTSTTVSIPSKSLSVSRLSLTEYDSSFWRIVTIGIIPILVLAIGLGIWMKRRKQ